MEKSNEPIPELRRLMLELHKLNTRLNWSVDLEEYMIKILQNLDGQTITDENTKKIHMINAMFRILFDYNIVTLHNIIEIQPTIERIVIQNKYNSLLESLKDAWGIINDEKKRIKKYRNLFVAHSLDNITKLQCYPQLEEFDKDFRNASTKISIAVRAGVFYLSPILYTFDDEWKRAMSEYRERGGEPDYTINSSKSFDEISNATQEIIEKVSKQLIKNGYMPLDSEGVF